MGGNSRKFKEEPSKASKFTHLDFNFPIIALVVGIFLHFFNFLVLICSQLPDVVFYIKHKYKLSLNAPSNGLSNVSGFVSLVKKLDL